MKQGRENDAILADLYAGRDVPLLPEVIHLVYDDIESLSVEAHFAGINSPTLTTANALLAVLLHCDNKPCVNGPKIGELVATLRTEIEQHATREHQHAAG